MPQYGAQVCCFGANEVNAHTANLKWCMDSIDTLSKFCHEANKQWWHDPATGEIIEPDAHRDGGIKPESTAAMPEQGGASSKASCTHDAGEVHGRCEPTSPPKSAEMEIPSFLRRTQPAMQPAE